VPLELDIWEYAGLGQMGKGQRGHLTVGLHRLRLQGCREQVLSLA
jgi:hypothetical protein